jgi:hypothetical protein
MATRYLAGNQGAVTIGGTAYKVTTWKYDPTVDTVKSRAAGDGAYSQVPIAKFWEFTCTIVTNLAGTIPNVASLIGTNVAFVADTDSTPKLRVSGTGIVMSDPITSPADDNVTVELTIQCSDADAANLPTVTVA